VISARLELHARVDRREGRKIWASMHGRVDDDVAVEAEALYVMVGLEHFVPHAERMGERMAERPYNPRSGPEAEVVGLLGLPCLGAGGALGKLGAVGAVTVRLLHDPMPAHVPAGTEAQAAAVASPSPLAGLDSRRNLRRPVLRIEPNVPRPPAHVLLLHR